MADTQMSVSLLNHHPAAGANVLLCALRAAGQPLQDRLDADVNERCVLALRGYSQCTLVMLPQSDVSGIRMLQG